MFAGICGSDLHEYEGGPIFTPGYKPQYITGNVNPVTIGHEFAGIVSAVGPASKLQGRRPRRAAPAGHLRQVCSCKAAAGTPATT